VFSPDRTLTADYQLQAWQNGKWITALTATYSSTGSNTAFLYVDAGRPGVKFRFVGTFSGDEYNSKAPKAISKSFMID
jgi:hypothetical protein